MLNANKTEQDVHILQQTTCQMKDYVPCVLSALLSVCLAVPRLKSVQQQTVLSSSSECSSAVGSVGSQKVKWCHGSWSSWTAQAREYSQQWKYCGCDKKQCFFFCSLLVVVAAKKLCTHSVGKPEPNQYWAWFECHSADLKLFVWVCAALKKSSLIKCWTCHCLAVTEHFLSFVERTMKWLVSPRPSLDPSL